MSPVIPTSEGAVSFYDDLHCKKFAYRREPGVLPVGRGIKILIGVFEWKESWFFIATPNTIMPSSDMCARFWALKTYICQNTIDDAN